MIKKIVYTLEFIQLNCSLAFIFIREVKIKIENKQDISSSIEYGLDTLQSENTFEKKNSPAPTLSLQRFKRLQIKWLG